MQSLEKQAEVLHQEAFKAYKKKNVDRKKKKFYFDQFEITEARRCLKREKMLRERYQELANKKDTLEDQILSLESAASSKDLVKLLQQVNEAQNEFKLYYYLIFSILILIY